MCALEDGYGVYIIYHAPNSKSHNVGSWKIVPFVCRTNRYTTRTGMTGIRYPIIVPVNKQKLKEMKKETFMLLVIESVYYYKFDGINTDNPVNAVVITHDVICGCQCTSLNCSLPLWTNNN